MALGGALIPAAVVMLLAVSFRWRRWWVPAMGVGVRRQRWASAVGVESSSWSGNRIHVLTLPPLDSANRTARSSSVRLQVAGRGLRRAVGLY